MSEVKLCNDILINVSKVMVLERDIKKYIEFSKCLDNLLRRKYGKYYICDQVNQLKDNPTVFFVETFYRNIPCVYEVIEEIMKCVEEAYCKEFGNCIERISITSFTTVKKVYPDRADVCEEPFSNLGQNNQCC